MQEPSTQAIHRFFEMLQRSPSLQTFMHPAAFSIGESQQSGTLLTFKAQNPTATSVQLRNGLTRDLHCIDRRLHAMPPKKMRCSSDQFSYFCLGNFRWFLDSRRSYFCARR